MQWLTDLEVWQAKASLAWNKLKALKYGIWTIASAHPELEADVRATFAALLGAATTKSASGLLVLATQAEQTYSDFTAAYTGESANLKVLLEQLKALVA